LAVQDWKENNNFILNRVQTQVADFPRGIISSFGKRNTLISSTIWFALLLCFSVATRYSSPTLMPTIWRRDLESNLWVLLIILFVHLQDAGVHVLVLTQVCLVNHLNPCYVMLRYEVVKQW